MQAKDKKVWFVVPSPLCPGEDISSWLTMKDDSILASVMADIVRAVSLRWCVQSDPSHFTGLSVLSDVSYSYPSPMSSFASSSVSYSLVVPSAWPYVPVTLPSWDVSTVSPLVPLVSAPPNTHMPVAAPRQSLPVAVPHQVPPVAAPRQSPLVAAPCQSCL